MIGRHELTNRVVMPTTRVRVIVEFYYGGRVRKTGEELQVTENEAMLFSANGRARVILGLRR